MTWDMYVWPSLLRVQAYHTLPPLQLNTTLLILILKYSADEASSTTFTMGVLEKIEDIESQCACHAQHLEIKADICEIVHLQRRCLGVSTTVVIGASNTDLLCSAKEVGVIRACHSEHTNVVSIYVSFSKGSFRSPN